jgi:glycosyltransferase involved in cell wall biosynthesis
MIICINALSALRGGGQTYLINLLQEIRSSKQKVILIVSKKNYDVFSEYACDNIDLHLEDFVSTSIFHRVFWELFKLPKFLKSNGASRYYAPGGIMITPMPRGVESITALRNMLPFDDNERKRFSYFSFNRYKLFILKFVFLISYKMSNRVIFISNTSKNIISDLMPEIESKSAVIPHGINPSFYDTNENIDERLEDGKFYLYVSILDVYKCQKEMVLTWKRLIKNGFEYPLVLIGPKYNSYGDEVIKIIEENNLQDKIIYLGKVDYKLIGAYYKAARCLVFASSCECCPNILLEKLAAGKPVLSSNIPPMPEFGGDSVLYFDPYNIDSIEDRVLYVESSEKLRKNLSIKAYKRSKYYDWCSTIDKTVQYIINSKR